MKTRQEKVQALLRNSNGFFKPKEALMREINEANKAMEKAPLKEASDPTAFLLALRGTVLLNNLKAALNELEKLHTEINTGIEATEREMPEDLKNIMHGYL